MRDHDPTTNSILKIGQLAQLCNKTVRAIHLYEELGLLKPAHRTKGGFRVYSSDAVERIRWICRLQEADLSLAQIKEFLSVLSQQSIATEAMDHVRALFEKKLTELREQQIRLKALEADLSAGLQYLASCKSCEPVHTTKECENCKIHGHTGNSPLLVAGLHHR